ncbi:hemicentin-1-like [Ruditapes philippinarum]|uniref:hemicentin-1-like n=1 Tax=Ruditapes philippinarum TaxID=129788 RepID=UPI00295B2D07|nr:hemicentin-1-like [Ruditapes philippinarum]
MLNNIFYLTFWISICNYKAFGCPLTVTQYKRPRHYVTIQFQAITKNTEDSTLSVTNEILSNTGSKLLIALYRNSTSLYIGNCTGCTFTGNAATGDLAIRLDNLHQSDGGTYKHAVTQASREVKECVVVYILGQPTKPSITINKLPFEGETAILTCISISTTTPRDPNLRIVYNWNIDNNNIPSDSRHTYSNTRNKLTISNISRNDANKNFTCAAKEDLGNAYTSTISDPLKIDVYYKPDTGPLIQSSSKLFGNNTIFRAIGTRQQTLDCSVTGGYPSPSLSWACFMGTVQDLSSGQTITKRWTWTASTNGTCKCTSIQMGAASEVVLNVRLLLPPTSPELQLNSQNVQPSSTVKIIRDSTKPIICSSTSVPLPEYKWTYNGQTTEVSQDATLNPSQVTRNGIYYCNAQNRMTPSLGSTETGNSSAFIDIQILSPPSKPELRYHDRSGSVITGRFKVVRRDNFNLYCSSTGNPTANYRWTGDGRTISDQVIAVSSIQQDRSYTCKATNTMNPTNDANVTRTSTSTVSVSVLSPVTSPTIEYHYSQSERTPVTSTLKAIKGKSFSVSCSSTGIPTPTLSWSGQIFSNTNKLAITSIQSNATYVCTASNYMNRTFGTKEIVTITSDLHMEILYGPSVKPFNIEPVVEGSTLSVECKADPGNPACMTYSWRRKLNSSSMNNWQIIPDSIIFVNEGKLVKQNINRNDAGTYNCTASNVMKPTAENQQIGSSSRTFLLDVLYETSIMSFFEVSEPTMTDVTKHENSSINLQCTVDSNPGSTIAILKSRENIASVVKAKQISYKKEKISCDAAGLYTCVAYNDYNGETRPSKELRLYVTCKPNPPENVNYLDGSLEQTLVIITWKPGFHGGLNQTFHVTYKKQSDSSWKEITIPDKGTTRMNVTLFGLEPGTSYVFQMFSRNPEGSSDVTEILTFTTRGKTDEPGINAALIGGLLTGSVIVIAVVVVFSVFLRRKYWKKGIQRDRSESRHSGNDAYTDLQDMQSGIHIYNDFDYVNTAHDHSSSENDTNVYTVLEPNVDENKEHIYKKLELKSTPNDGQHVYENL